MWSAIANGEDVIYLTHELFNRVAYELMPTYKPTFLFFDDEEKN